MGEWGDEPTIDSTGGRSKYQVGLTVHPNTYIFAYFNNNSWSYFFHRSPVILWVCDCGSELPPFIGGREEGRVKKIHEIEEKKNVYIYTTAAGHDR